MALAAAISGRLVSWLVFTGATTLVLAVPTTWERWVEPMFRRQHERRRQIGRGPDDPEVYIRRQRARLLVVFGAGFAFYAVVIALRAAHA